MRFKSTYREREGREECWEQQGYRQASSFKKELNSQGGTVQAHMKKAG